LILLIAVLLGLLRWWCIVTPGNIVTPKKNILECKICKHHVKKYYRIEVYKEVSEILSRVQDLLLAKNSAVCATMPARFKQPASNLHHISVPEVPSTQQNQTFYQGNELIV
jgi:hypothetical protein